MVIKPELVQYHTRQTYKAEFIGNYQNEVKMFCFRIIVESERCLGTITTRCLRSFGPVVTVLTDNLAAVADTRDCLPRRYLNSL